MALMDLWSREMDDRFAATSSAILNLVTRLVDRSDG